MRRYYELSKRNARILLLIMSFGLGLSALLAHYGETTAMAVVLTADLLAVAAFLVSALRQSRRKPVAGASADSSHPQLSGPLRGNLISKVQEGLRKMGLPEDASLQGGPRHYDNEYSLTACSPTWRYSFWERGKERVIMEAADEQAILFCILRQHAYNDGAWKEWVRRERLQSEWHYDKPYDGRKFIYEYTIHLLAKVYGKDRLRDTVQEYTARLNGGASSPFWTFDWQEPAFIPVRQQ